MLLSKGKTITGTNPEMERELQLSKRLEEAKTKNSAFQSLDKMLAFQNHPKLNKIREENPLNNIKVPQGDLSDVDDRIGQFSIPVDGTGETMHPLLSVSQYQSPYH